MKRKLNVAAVLMALALLAVVAAATVFAVRWVMASGPHSPATSRESSAPSTDPAPSASTAELTEPATEPTAEPTTEKQRTLRDLKDGIDVGTIRPNEVGEVMIIMYHGLMDENSAYHRTVPSFKADLQRLYDMGFRTVSMTDYINSNFDIPAGTTPIVLTFDDGLESNFRYIPGSDGQVVIDPNCVVGILDAFAEEHPDFGRNAIFYLNGGTPFRQADYVKQKLRYLIDNGYEIGNHAHGHEDLSKLDGAGVQEALGKNANYYEDLTDGYRFFSLALPFGIAPKDPYKQYVTAGTYEGREYRNETVLMVGWRPTWPLYRAEIDPSSLYRVQSGDDEVQLTWWLDNYEENPAKRYVSDGVPEVISVPESARELVAPEYAEQEKFYFYD